jgi:hypothetical protein
MTIDRNGAILPRSGIHSYQLHELFSWLSTIEDQQPEFQDPAVTR